MCKPAGICGKGNACKADEEPETLAWKRLILSALVAASAWVLPVAPAWKVGLYLVSYLFCGGSVLGRSWNNLRRGKVFDENFLMSVATLGALAIGEYPEAISVMFLYQVGEVLQARAAGKSRAGIVHLLSLRPDFARVVRNGQEITKKPEEVAVGESILVRPGERVALDGVVTAGHGQADLSALTGESRPVAVNPGKTLWAGSICLESALTIRVTKNYENSAIAQILELTEAAAAKKSSTEKFITRFARIYTPLVVGGALAVALVPPLFTPQADLHTWVSRALVFLVVSCPCALVLSVPLSFFGGLGGLAHQGVLVKGSSYLELLSRLGTLAFDKTGTLTCGVFELTRITPFNGAQPQEVLQTAASLEQHSNHPVAKAILHAAGKDARPPLEVREIAGEGVHSPDGRFLAGSAQFLARFGVKVPPAASASTGVYVARDGRAIGVIELGDRLKEGAAQTVRQLLKGLVRRIVILSGDTPRAVAKTAQDAGIKEFYGGLLPEGKVRKLEELMRREKRGRATAFVGDGVNDAPVLARADVSVAMGGLGTDAAIQTADVVLMTDNLSHLVTAVRHARFTLHIVRQNVGLALGIKAIVMLLGVWGYASLWMAVFADVGVTLIAVSNALRPLYYRE